MNNKLLYIITLISLLISISCSDYLEVDLQDQMTLEEVFNKRATTERYLTNVYGYIPDVYNLIRSEEGSVVPRSDEASFSWLSITYMPFNNGSWGPSNEEYQSWSWNYEGIAQATIFMDNIELNKEIREEEKKIMKAEARFIRAYLYFSLLKKYGPVFVWGDNPSDGLIKPEDIDRHSLEQNVDFIVSEYDKAIAELPMVITDNKWYGRATKGVAMAAKSRLLTYMARPLFNGSDLYKGLKNIYGDFLFPQSYDAKKWDLAAKAAKDIIDLNQYELYVDESETDFFTKAIKSYMGVVFKSWNKEIIWGKYIEDASYYNVRSAPPRVVKEGFGGFCPSIKLVDTYPMASTGRFPVEGYQEDGSPIIDNLSGYSETGFTDNWMHPLDDFAPIKAHNSIIGRDARFYASVLANGMNWINTYKGIKNVTFFDGGTSSYDDAVDCVKVGYLWRRMSDPANNIEEDSWGQLCMPMFRFAEIYLNYAEACNEKENRDETEALKYINLIRQRSGLNKLETAYPEVVGNKKLLRELIQKERMVELAFECHRYYDIRTWMTAPEEFNGKRYARNLLADNYEDSWERTDKIFKEKMVFQNKHYFFPIHQNQLKEMRNITQNYGW